MRAVIQISATLALAIILIVGIAGVAHSDITDLSQSAPFQTNNSINYMVDAEIHAVLDGTINVQSVMITVDWVVTGVGVPPIGNLGSTVEVFDELDNLVYSDAVGRPPGYGTFMDSYAFPLVPGRYRVLANGLQLEFFAFADGRTTDEMLSFLPGTADPSGLLVKDGQVSEQPGNYVPNSRFADDVAGWSATNGNGTLAWDALDSVGSTLSGSAHLITGSGNSGIQTDCIPAVNLDGQLLDVFADGLIDGVSPGRFTMAISFYDDVQCLEFLDQEAGTNGLTTVDQWSTLSNQVLVPAGADGLSLTLAFSPIGATGIVNFDNVFVPEPASSGAFAGVAVLAWIGRRALRRVGEGTRVHP